MIVDLARFVAAEESYWRRLDEILDQRRKDPWALMSLEQARELDYLYRRTAADLARVATFSAEPEMRRRLEQLVARAYTEIHGVRRSGSVRLRPWHWLTVVLPQTFRRHARAAALAALVTLAGAIFGGVAVAVDPDAKQVILPFSHLLVDPKERVAQEEAMRADPLAAHVEIPGIELAGPASLHAGRYVGSPVHDVAGGQAHFHAPERVSPLNGDSGA